MIVGMLGNIIFYTSSKSVKTFTDLNKTRDARIAKHEIIGGKQKLEFQGVDLMPVSFNIRLDRGLGVEPSYEMSRIERLWKNGYVCDLIIGIDYLGEFLISSIGETVNHTDRFGNTIVSDVAISLLEYN